MSQRDSGYERKERDLYETPEWVTRALLNHLAGLVHIWEPAEGSGKMCRVLTETEASVTGSDIAEGADFLKLNQLPHPMMDAIITNPPYEFATQFCEHALELMREPRGVVAMLLRTDFDHAKSRRHIFGDCEPFYKKVVLTKRIVWFEPPPGEKGKSPSFNHAWFIWDWDHKGDAELAYE